ncbi:sugar kinase [Nonomuraea sp. NPDC050310]|uniref:carbohydrate kinase family protein n=1 Tax=Nonomuraea sp. NPDC050310 TaxID=3154935 RepID=UPI0033FC1031
MSQPTALPGRTGPGGAAGLLVIGDIVTDVVAIHGTPVASGTDTDADIALRPGGSGANTAAWAAYLGADARLLGRAGYDSADWHLSELTKVGVTPLVLTDPDYPTAVVIAMVDPSGERSMLTNRGAGGRISPADWRADALDGVARLHLSAYTFFTPSGLDLVRLAVAEAVSRDVTISVDPASTGPLRAFGLDRFLAETAAARLIIPNRDEALLLTGESDPERAALALSRRYGTAVVKLGGDGALVAVDGELRAVAAASGTAGAVVDSTGAGDAFAAGYLTAKLQGADEPQALEQGIKAGAECVALVGGRPRYGLATKHLYPIHAD